MIKTVLLPALALALSAACASTPAPPGRPQRVAFLDYRNGTHLELVNETHTGRLEQYSAVVRPTEATRKVQTDDVMAALVELLRDEGFDDLGQEGPAPVRGGDTGMMAIELEDGDRIEHVLGFKGMPAADRQKVLSLAQSIVEIYNATYGLQAVELKEGESPFQNPVGPTREKLPKVPEGQG
jgi:hypothetical protein